MEKGAETNRKKWGKNDEEVLASLNKTALAIYNNGKISDKMKDKLLLNISSSIEKYADKKLAIEKVTKTKVLDGEKTKLIFDNEKKRLKKLKN